MTQISYRSRMADHDIPRPSDAACLESASTACPGSPGTSNHPVSAGTASRPEGAPPVHVKFHCEGTTYELPAGVLRYVKHVEEAASDCKGLAEMELKDRNPRAVELVCEILKTMADKPLFEVPTEPEERYRTDRKLPEWWEPFAERAKPKLRDFIDALALASYLGSTQLEDLISHTIARVACQAETDDDFMALLHGPEKR